MEKTRELADDFFLITWVYNMKWTSCNSQNGFTVCMLAQFKLLPFRNIRRKDFLGFYFWHRVSCCLSKAGLKLLIPLSLSPMYHKYSLSHLPSKISFAEDTSSVAVCYKIPRMQFWLQCALILVTLQIQEHSGSIDNDLFVL